MHRMSALLSLLAVLLMAAPAQAMLSRARMSSLHTSLKEIRQTPSRAKGIRGNQCWAGFENTPTSFLEVAEARNETSIQQARTVCIAALEYESKKTSILTAEQRRGCEAILNVQNPDLYHGFDANLYGPLWNAFPKMAGALFGRSVFSGCKCEGNSRRLCDGMLVLNIPIFQLVCIH